MEIERAKQIMGWVGFQGLKKVVADARVSEEAAEILNLAISANEFMLANRGPEAYDGNADFQKLISLDVPEDFQRSGHYAVRQNMFS